MGFGLGDIIGGIAGAGVSAYGQRQQLKWEREKAQNAHQWEVQDLIKAGLNPVLSAGGQGASAGSIGGIDGSTITSGFSSAMQRKIEKQRLELEKRKGKAEIKNINAQTENAKAQTARTLALTPEEKQTMKHNRLSYVEKEIIKPAWRTLVNGGAVGSAISTKRFRENLRNDIKKGKATTFPFYPLKINKPTK